MRPRLALHLSDRMVPEGIPGYQVHLHHLPREAARKPLSGLRDDRDQGPTHRPALRMCVQALMSRRQGTLVQDVVRPQAIMTRKDSQ